MVTALRDFGDFFACNNLFLISNDNRIALNARRRPLNCNLYTIEPLQRDNPLLVAAVLNSSLVILAKHLFGRPAGVEGNLKTEIVDVDMMPVPDWTLATPALRRKLAFAMRTIHQTGDAQRAKHPDSDPESSPHLRLRPSLR